jgi:release factor glutamine methyltransferase
MNSVKTLADVMNMFREGLSGYYSDGEIRNMFNLASEHLLNYSKIDIHISRQDPISTEVLENFSKFLARLRNWEPVQYIMGSADFYGLSFHVDPRVLIPRPETEELVDWIVKEEYGRAADILDLGTGSGCIAVSLAVSQPGTSVSACDISEDILALARENAAANRATVDFFRLDILGTGAVLPQQYQVMVSNPPYVRQMEKTFMRHNVLDFEPGLALFVPDNDPLCYYRNLALLGRKYLKDGGSLYLEINENLPRETVRLLESAGFYGVEVRPDINGKARMVRGRK